MLLSISISGWWVAIVPAVAYGIGLLTYHIVSSKVSKLLTDLQARIIKLEAAVKAKL